jgi:hypothetical protein
MLEKLACFFFFCYKINYLSRDIITKAKLCGKITIDQETFNREL